MKKEFKIEGMSCVHCRKSVEDALNSIEGVNAVVTLQPPLATIEFINEELSLEKLQGVLSETGDFIISYC